MSKEKCSKCGKEYSRSKLVIVNKKLVCSDCFPKALDDLFNRIKSINAQILTRRKPKTFEKKKPKRKWRKR